MTLLNYLKTLSKTDLAAMADRCSTSPGQLKQIAYGNRRASVSLAVSLDRETSGSVSCAELRPDIDWKHLRSALSQSAA